MVSILKTTQCFFSKFWVSWAILQRKLKKNRVREQIHVNTCFSGELIDLQVARRAERPSYGIKFLGGGLCSLNVALDVKEHAEVAQRRETQISKNDTFAPF